VVTVLNKCVVSQTIVVTGAAGFIGSHVAEALVQRGDRVIGLDNFNDYYDPERKRSNVRDVMANLDDVSRYDMRDADFPAGEMLNELFASSKVAAIVHLGAMPGVRASMDAPQLYFDVNLMGTLNLLDCARQHRVSHFVFASTSSVYGTSKTLPFVETDVCDQPLAPYPASKRAAELLGYSYHHLYGMNFTALRFFTVYGPRGRPDMMAYKIFDNIFKGRRVALYNGGKMHRDWTYVSDVVAGIMAAVDRPLGYEKLNVGRGEPTLLADFVEQVETLTGRKSALHDEPMPRADMPYTSADLSKTASLLDYQPKISFEEGTERFWHWYQQRVLES